MAIVAACSAESAPVNLLNFSLDELSAFFCQMGEKSFRANQIFRWIHHRGVDNFEAMTDLSKSFRERLPELCCIKPPVVTREDISSDGTIKWLMSLDGGNSIETVFIPEKNRGTLCVSSQVGCALNCTFCSTGAQGFNRNLTAAEIIGQLWLANQRLKALEGGVVTNVVMMGMGEPLLNYQPVITAMSIMRSDLAYALPRKRVTLSTSGMVPYIDRLNEDADVSLAISLHAPNDTLRTELVPLNKKYPIAQLLAACHRFVDGRANRHITMEYVMLRGVNDQLSHAKTLAKILKGLACKINLIPFNPFPGSEYICSKQADMEAFQKTLMRSGYIVTIRRTRGQDIDAACGQLVGQVNDRTRRSQKRKELNASLPFVLEEVV